MTADATPRLRVALVGAGRRAREQVFPAVHCMQRWVDVSDVFTSAPRRLDLLDGAVQRTTRSDLASATLRDLDAVIVTVPRREVPHVLDALLARDCDHLRVLIDTPVLDPRDLAAARGFTRFREVLAAEDCFALPQIAVARQLIEAGRVGELRHVDLVHSAYRHHALASLRRITDAAPLWLSSRRWTATGGRLSARYPGGVTATIIDPRSYEVGRMLVYGTRGLVADYPIDAPNATCLGYEMHDGVFEGLSVDGVAVPHSERDDAFVAGLQGRQLADSSLMGQLKIRGYMELLAGLADPNAARYDAVDAIHDNLLMETVARTRVVPSVERLLRTWTGAGRARGVEGDDAALPLAVRADAPRSARLPPSFRDARAHDGTDIECDVCIVGTGAAGATTAAILERTGVRVCVLEAGGEREGNDPAADNALDVAGLHVKERSRARFLGGTTNLWYGIAAVPHDIDLETRSWVADSGWPIAPDALAPFLRRACKVLGVVDLTAITSPPPQRRQRGFVYDGGDLATMVAYQPASPMRFGRIYREQLGSSPTVTTWLHARATDVVLSDDHTRVAAVRVSTSAGGTFAVNARAVVLAAGAIENARLLLASCTQQTDGIGNGRGVVGRFYMDHPKGPCGLLHVSSRFATLPHPRYSLSHRGLRFGVRLSDGAQARLGVLDSYVRLTPMFIDDATRPALAELARRRVGALRDRDAVQGLARDLPALTAHSWFRVANRGIRMTYEIRNFLEQEPRRESRVELSDRRDALGELLPRVTWSLSELDRRSIVELHRALALDVEARGIGRMESPLLSQDWAAVDDWPIAVDAAHHLGTTRMGTSLATSVTDPDGQVHGVANLFVSGGSLFPTSGYANPTLTIIALALRQSEHLARTLGIEVT